MMIKENFRIYIRFRLVCESTLNSLTKLSVKRIIRFFNCKQAICIGNQTTL